jgi:nitrite reductase/ring-hydroxylating ferredoxin subunit
MATRTHLASVDEIPERGSLRFAVEDPYGSEDEIIVVPCEEDPGVAAWVNRCTHEAQRLDVGRGAAMRNGGIICPKHGSIFDACSGECDNGDAAGTTLPEVEIAVELGEVYLVDDGYELLAETEDDGDDGPSSSSHLSL